MHILETTYNAKPMLTGSRNSI